MNQALCDNWDQHWSDFSEASELSPATRYRHDIAIRLLGLRDQGGGVRLLDIGSGSGGFATHFCPRFPRTRFHGLELSQTGVKLSARRVPQATFEVRNLLEPAAKPEFRATHAVCSEVLEHLDDPAALLRNATDYMAPGCKLVVTVPGGSPTAYDLYIGHRRHYTASDLKQLLESAGFEVEMASGVGFPFFNLYRMLVTLRGDKVKDDVAGRPSLALRTATAVFRFLFRFNLMSAGWQTVAVARYRV